MGYWLQLPKGAIFGLYEENPSFSTDLFYIRLAKAFSFSICWIVGLIQVPSHPTRCLYSHWLHLYLSSLAASHHLSVLLCSHITHSPLGVAAQFLIHYWGAKLSFLFHNISRRSHTYYNGSIIRYFIDPQGNVSFLLAHDTERSEVRLSYHASVAKSVSSLCC